MPQTFPAWVHRHVEDDDQTEYRVVVPGRAYPHPRVTHMEIRRAVGRRNRRGRLTGKDLAVVRYLSYREAVKLATMAARIPEIVGDAEIHAVFWFTNRTHGDRVNLIKAAEDGVAASGIVRNDKQFRWGTSAVEYGDSERTEISIRPLGDV